MRVFESRERRRQFVLAALGVALAFAGLYALVRRYLPFLTSGAELRALVAEAGAFGPLVFIGVQAAQVVVAPIPGQATAFVSGYLFGAVRGTVYSLVGVTIGSFVAFWLSRRYGRPFVERAIRAEVLARFDAFVEEAGTLGLLVVFLVPGLPDDAVCFAAGLTDVRLRKLVAIVIVGRTPAYVLVNLSGASLAEGDFRLSVLLALATLALSVWGILRREWLLERLERWAG
jgi:uncharacterized membrane protein YdjX (TVP38/TMEM64 family)